MSEPFSKAYIVAVDMGYGHQRAAYPLLSIATTPSEWNIVEPMVISANNYPSIPKIDRLRWEETRRLYEWISRFRGFPFFGKRLFHLMDYVQKIESFYPRRDLSEATPALKRVYRLVRKGMGKHLIETLNKKPLPLICTFPIIAFFAEEHNYKGEIFCLCTDTDIARAWVPLEPKTSRITYLAPTVRAKERLKQYGVRPEKIILTGFPLPQETIGNRLDLDVARGALARRISKLDPQGMYQKKYEKLLELYLGSKYAVKETKEPLTITFAIGGAGAQSNIAIILLKTLREHINSGTIRLHLIAGTSPHLFHKFKRSIEKYKVNTQFAHVLYNPNKFEYFKKFNQVLVESDILWTKPSEMSFYVGLGLPIIMTPPLGTHEECNRDWLHMIGAGFEQYNPRFADEWLFDWLKSGWLASAAVNGFLNAPKMSTYHIEDIALRGKKVEVDDIHFI